MTKYLRFSLLGAMILVAMLSAFQGVAVWAANQTILSQTITDGVQSVDIVDASGNPVASAGVTFPGLTFSFDSQTAEGVFGSVDEKIRVFNPTSDVTWTVSLAATDGATALWSGGAAGDYDFNDANADGTDGADADSVGGRLTVNPSAGTVAGVSSCAATNVNKGSSGSFQQGVTDSITLLTGAAGAAAYCRWDFTGTSFSQVIPASQPSGTYTIDLTLTVV